MSGTRPAHNRPAQHRPAQHRPPRHEPRSDATAVADRAGTPAVAIGQVWHRRNKPTVHDFSYPVKQLWLDPDRPRDLMDALPIGPRKGLRPVQFRPKDYLDGDGGPFGPTLRGELEPVLGFRPTGPIRMLTQPRTWGWLFNPITVYLVWPTDRTPGDAGGPVESAGGGPCGAVLEVTNTPWKERHRYPVALHADGGRFEAEFDKLLHVSPFLDEEYRYRLTLAMTLDGEPDADRHIELGLDVVPRSTGDGGTINPVVETRLQVQLLPPTRRNMKTMILQNPLPTHRVSLGIHWQAARLLAKRVPFVTHPVKRS